MIFENYPSNFQNDEFWNPSENFLKRSKNSVYLLFLIIKLFKKSTLEKLPAKNNKLKANHRCKYKKKADECKATVNEENLVHRLVLCVDIVLSDFDFLEFEFVIESILGFDPSKNVDIDHVDITEKLIVLIGNKLSVNFFDKLL